jgi:hypothetical protein
LNYLSLNVGSASARSIVPSPLGTFFSGPDSAYLVTPFGGVTPVSFNEGSNVTPDLRQPFGNVLTPSRVAASFSGNIYRICLPTVVDGVSGTYDYWFDVRKKRWNGPHTFIYDCASSDGEGFFLSGIGSGAKLFNSDTTSDSTSTFLDNGAQYFIDMLSSDFPKKDEMAMKQIVESTIELSSTGSAVTYSLLAYDDKNNILDTTGVTTYAQGSIWGANLWGDGSKWTATLNRVITYQVYWNKPLVLNKMAIELTTTASSAIAIGTFYVRYQKTGYLLQG